MLDVARIAGVSTSTVSHVVNGTRTVDPATEMQVRTAIAQLGYRPNIVARALATSRTMNIGLCLPITANPTFVVLVDVIERRLTAAGYHLMLHDSRDDIAVQARTVRQLLDLRADGIILAPAPDPALSDSVLPDSVPADSVLSDSVLSDSVLSDSAPVESVPADPGRADPGRAEPGQTQPAFDPVARPDAGGIRTAIDAHTPLVLIDRFAAADCDQVASDGVEPMRALTAHLAANGHRRIAVVAGLTGIGTTVERLQGYRDAVAAMGLDSDPELVIPGESDLETTRAGVSALFSRSDRPSALVTTNNVMTLGSMRAFVDLGLRVPDDVALVCFDDFEWTDLFTPRLTAMGQDLATMGDRAVQLLLRRIADPTVDTQRLRVTPTFHHRDSCGCPPAPVVSADQHRRRG
ncbi:MAG TPA: substrate-binding domain-containing protein [Nakamurella sp.]|nr:substrate-binding domain-containing protein [Nakamurella sp.]